MRDPIDHQQLGKTERCKMRREYSREKLKQFFLGLLDGDGSIQCNHWRRKGLQYRFVIKLKNHPANVKMLLLIKQHFGGVARPSGADHFLWVENHQRRIWQLSAILERYPPLTSRVLCQWQFLKQCGEHKSVQWMLENRQYKYAKQEEWRTLLLREQLSRRSYWPLWCSGFIEAEGCFSLRRGENHSFSIGQKNDLYLIDSLRRYFGGTNSVRTIGKDFYFWEVYKRSVLKNIYNHCQQHPLLGEKSCSLCRFANVVDVHS